MLHFTSLDAREEQPPRPRSPSPGPSRNEGPQTVPGRGATAPIHNQGKCPLGDPLR